MSNIIKLDETDRFLVTQHNDLIEANYLNAMTARAHKVARLLISMLSPDLKELGEITIEINALKRFLGYKKGVTWGRFHKDLEDIAERLNEKSIKIELRKRDTLVTYFVSSYRVNVPDGEITFQLSPKLVPFLLHLKDNYTSYSLINTRNLRSTYSIRLYELLHQYRKIGKRYFDLENLQNKLGAKYPRYFDFKRYAILQAQKDLKKHTNLAFVFEERKRGRRVVGIEFIILANQPANKSNQLSFLEDAIEVNEAENPAFSKILIQTLNEMGIAEQAIVKCLTKGFDVIENEKRRTIAMERCQTLENYYLEKLEMTRNAKTKNNTAGFFIKALKEDWIDSKTLEKKQIKDASKKRNDAKRKIKSLESQINNLNDKKEKTKIPIFADLLADDDVFKTAYNAAIKELGSFMLKHIASSQHLPMRERYAKELTIQVGVHAQLSEQYPERFTEVQKIEDEIQAIQTDIQAIKKEHKGV